MRKTIQLPLTLGLMSFSTVALAHPGHESAGFAEGLLHPFSGMDHLLAMLAVGLWAAQLGGRAVWQIPAAFLALLCLGGVLGMNGIILPSLELGIVGSVVVFGALIAAGKKLPVSIGMGIASIFALFHGAAHGLEMPAMTSGLSYSIGFVAASLILHASGLLAAYATRLAPLAVRFIGATIATAGTVLLSGI